MGDVAISIKIMPSSEKTDMKKIQKEVKKMKDLSSLNIEEIGFGLKALKAVFVRPDSQGGTDDIEEALKKIKGVETVEVEDVSLI